MLLALDLCCQGQEGLLPPALAFVLGMQFPLSACNVCCFPTVFVSVWSGKACINHDTGKPATPGFVYTESLLASAASLCAMVCFNLVSSHMATLCRAAASIPDR